MSYRIKLRPGDCVAMNERGIRQGLDGRRKARTGVVQSVYRLNPAYAQILRDGYKRSECWNVSFWTKAVV